jgi:hypothetical protein
MVAKLLRRDDLGRMSVMVMGCLFALAPVSCRAMGGDQGGVTGDDACTAATTLAQQFIAGLDQWDQSTVLDTLVPDQRLGARAAWVAANQVRERQNVDIDFEDLTSSACPPTTARKWL